ncbi:restriction endonuclease subunit S [Bacillus atrophaeus]|uniref:restriction endonuclease subunit S n=1 Tax=Bacillus atrophaeus TaxID=1452 RepID=UPI002E21DAE0|nr:restriction endonuclease subunit S [Bacillus atrophaeus]MED1032378.1 restriction endonuclease subunit S [Bacillus atrophaeus]MED1119516.1 restriction endonuclease subunit S [Bacillus atrophaeus]MED1130248.1 restriction endonuclease subunit S [Bacillus atrophaeus]
MGNKRTPEIRFSGYSGDWEKRKLGEISEKVTEKNKNNIYSETLTNSAEFGIINQRDFFDKDISNEKNLDGYYVVRPDDFVYNPRISNLAPVGPIKRNKLGRTGVMSPLYYVFRTHGVDKIYLEKYFSSNSWHIFMKLNGDSGARSDRFAIKDSLFREMPIPIPSIEEQTKIGDFFKQLDDTIALHQQELTTLKQTKQGFLQKMFPKEGESVPEVRFPGFTGDWEQHKLDSIVDRVKSYSLSRDVETTEYTGYKYIHYGDIHTKVADIIDEFSDLPNIKAGNYELLKKGDLVLADASEDYQGIAAPAVITIDVPYKLVSGLHTIALRPKQIDSLFLYYLINSQTFRKYGYKAGTGMKVFGISATNLLRFESLFPTFEEQTKIGNFFKQLDDTIALHQRELDALKETKKAFLQKMFV